MDLSKINFEALRKRFKDSKHKNTELEVLKAAIRAQLEKLIRLNKTRMDFQEKFEELITFYNTGSRNIEELFNELVNLSRTLTDEEQRHDAPDKPCRWVLFRFAPLQCVAFGFA